MSIKNSLARAPIQRLANLFGYTIVPTSPSSDNDDPIMDEEISEIFEKCRKYTMTSKERVYALRNAVEYIASSKIPGDFVECGVWRGGSAMVIAYSLLEMHEANRKIYLYDTFTGMAKPSEEDYLIADKDIFAESKWKKEQKEDHVAWAFSPLTEVKNNILSTGYPEDKLVFVRGKVEDTIPKTMPSKIALLRLDTDWYESTKHELTHLFPILVQNGVLLIDDYGHWAGSKKATDEYFSVNKIPILLHRVDYTARIGIKL
jgi:hypothetical protein